MSPLEKSIAAGTAGTVGLGLLYNVHQNMQAEAAKENDPVETTLDGKEKYLLDPAGKLSPTQALAIAGTVAAIPTAYKGYQAIQSYRDSKKDKKEN